MPLWLSAQACLKHSKGLTFKHLLNYQQKPTKTNKKKKNTKKEKTNERKIKEDLNCSETEVGS